MPLVPTGDLVPGRDDRGAVGAFNVITLEHAEAIVAGAEAAGLPVILAVSENAVRFHGGRLEPVAAACAAVARGAAVPVGLHLDHVEDEGLVAEAHAAGFGSVMVDASRLEYSDNVTTTARLAEDLHASGLWVEAELGEVGGKDGVHALGVRTDPAEAAAFVAATGVDALAVAVGSSHAMTQRSAALDLDLVARLRAAVPVPLVLHGSSGVPDEVLSAAVVAGIRKVNVGTALNIAFTRAVRAGLQDENVVDPRKYLTTAKRAMAHEVTHLLALLSS